jgi:hypothetical protein
MQSSPFCRVRRAPDPGEAGARRTRLGSGHDARGGRALPARGFAGVAVLLALACSRDTDPVASSSATAVPISADSSIQGAPTLSAPGTLAPPRPVAGPSSPAPVAAARPAAPAVASAPACRVVAVSGNVGRGEKPVRAGDVWNDSAVVELGPQATVRLMHTSSTRQWTLTGPARFVACDGGAEEIVLASGALRTEPGAGVRPGAEVWIGTPFGSLRYADARAELDVTTAALGLRVASGPLWFAPLGGDSPKERRVSGPTATFAAKPYRVSAARAIARCQRAATQAGERADALLSASSEPLGTRAADHVRARQQARGTCASARAALLSLPQPRAGAEPSDDRRAQSSELSGYDRLWRAVPATPRD